MLQVIKILLMKLKNIIYSALILIMMGCENDSAGPDVNPTGIAGSMARFAIAGDYLFTVDNKNLNVFDISQPSTAVKLGKIAVAPPGLTLIETIFPYKNHLFLGANTGMYIFNIDNPLTPALLSHYQHITACDPVVVKDTIAYVTLRSGRICGFSDNVLEVLNIKDLRNPHLINRYNMNNPHGLGISKDNILFVAEGDYGLKVFEASDPNNLKQTFQFLNLHGYDVIPVDDLLILIGEKGLYQYRAVKADSMKLLSIIPIAASDI